MPIPPMTRRYERGLLLVGVTAGLIALALVPGASMPKSFALAQAGWQAGQYRDVVGAHAVMEDSVQAHD